MFILLGFPLQFLSGSLYLSGFLRTGTEARLLGEQNPEPGPPRAMSHENATAPAAAPQRGDLRD